MLFYLISFTMAFLMTFLPGLPVLTAAIPVLTVTIVTIVLGIPVTSLVRIVPKAHGIIFVIIYLITSVALLGAVVCVVSLYRQLSLLPSFGAFSLASYIDGVVEALPVFCTIAVGAWTSAGGAQARVVSAPRRLRLRRVIRAIAPRAPVNHKLLCQDGGSSPRVHELQDSLKSIQEQVAALKVERDGAVAERNAAATVSAVSFQPMTSSHYAGSSLSVRSPWNSCASRLRGSSQRRRPHALK